jgi:hypothetical protein
MLSWLGINRFKRCASNPRFKNPQASINTAPVTALLFGLIQCLVCAVESSFMAVVLNELGNAARDGDGDGQAVGIEIRFFNNVSKLVGQFQSRFLGGVRQQHDKFFTAETAQKIGFPAIAGQLSGD